MSDQSLLFHSNDDARVLVIGQDSVTLALVVGEVRAAGIGVRGMTPVEADGALTGSFDLVVNATSASLHDAVPDLPAGVYASGSLAYDMMYGKGLTPFLQRAQAQGAARLADGIGMLVEQAAESFYVWRGVRPDTAAVIEQLRQQ